MQGVGSFFASWQPDTQPLADHLSVLGVRSERVPDERFAPGAVPDAVLSQREADLTEKKIALRLAELGQLAEDEVIQHWFDAEIERDQRLAPVVGAEEPFEQAPGRL